MLSETAIAGLIDRLYGSMTDPKGLQAVVREVGDSIGSSAPILIVRAANRTESLDGVAVDALPAFESSWAAPLRRFYEWRAAVARLRPGSVERMESLVTNAALGASEFYRDWMQPQGLRWSIVASPARETPGEMLLLFFRGSTEQPFGDGQLVLLARLMPHLERVARVRLRLDEAEGERRAALEALDGIRLGVILVDADSRICAANRSAEVLLARDDGVGKDRHGLRATHSEETHRLRSLIAEVAGYGSGGDPDAKRFTSLSRPSHDRRLPIMMKPLVASEAAALSETRPQVVVFTRDPEEQPDAPGEALCRLYDLTPAEARVASLLVQGRSLNCIAEELCLSRHTVRNELKRVFAKTGVNRQSELVRTLGFVPSLWLERQGEAVSPSSDLLE